MPSRYKIGKGKKVKNASTLRKEFGEDECDKYLRENVTKDRDEEEQPSVYKGSDDQVDEEEVVGTQGWQKDDFYDDDRIDESDDDGVEESDDDMQLQTQEARRMLAQQAKTLTLADFNQTFSRFQEDVVEAADEKGFLASDDDFPSIYLTKLKQRGEVESDDGMESVEANDCLDEVNEILDSFGIPIDGKHTSEGAFEQLRSLLKLCGVVTSQDLLDQLNTNDHSMFMDLMMELLSKLDSVTKVVQPLIRQVKEQKKLSKNAGLFLEAKSQLMLSYMQYLVYYMYLKITGTSTEHHPVIDRLMECRLLLEKLRPMADKFAYSIQKVLMTAHQERSDTVRLRPRIDMLDGSDSFKDGELHDGENDSEDDADNGDSTYQPPRMLAVEYTKDHESVIEKAKKLVEREKKRLSRSELVRAIREELDDVPEEVSGGASELHRNRVTAALLNKYQERENYELENMRRMPMTKKDKKELTLLSEKRKMLAGGSTLEELADFADETLRADDSVDATIGGKSKKGKGLSLGTYLNAVRGAKIKEQNIRNQQLTEQRIVAKKVRKPENPREETMRKDDDEDDYMDPLVASVAKEDEEHNVDAIPGPEPVVAGRRQIGQNIEKNRGLVRKRKKTSGNARVTNKLKYAKRMRVVNSSQRTPREGASSGGYGGEEKGFTGRVKRSTRLA